MNLFSNGALNPFRRRGTRNSVADGAKHAVGKGGKKAIAKGSMSAVAKAKEAMSRFGSKPNRGEGEGLLPAGAELLIPSKNCQV